MIKYVCDIAKEAGGAILEIYEKDKWIDREYKLDGSPLTIADQVSNRIIIESLEKLGGYPVLSEEGKEVSYSVRKSWSRYWCIDPLDGTKEFLKRNGEFTVNIALIEMGEPVLGVVYAPALDTIYYAEKRGGAYKNGVPLPIDGQVLGVSGIKRVVASKSHMSKETQSFIGKLGKVNVVSKGSSLKICMVADGSADIYPRMAPTMEWDTAAADAIVREVGKGIYVYDESFRVDQDLNVVCGNLLTYNKKVLVNPYIVVV